MGGGAHIVIYTCRHIARLGARSESVQYFRESENIAIEMSLNQGRLVQSDSDQQSSGGREGGM